MTTPLHTAFDAADSLAHALIETRTGESCLRPSPASEHPPCVPDAIADRTPTRTSRHHIVVPQGKDWGDDRPHAVWYAYDERVEAFKHPQAPNDSDWWFIMTKPFNGQKWLTGGGDTCVAPTAERAGDIIGDYLTGDDTAIATARTHLPESVTRTKSTAAREDEGNSTDAESTQQTFGTISD